MENTAQDTVNNMSNSLAAMLPEWAQWAVGPIIALLTIFIGYLIAKFFQYLVSTGINRTGIAQRAKTTGGNIGKSLSKAVFWVVWLFFILLGLSQYPAVSEALSPISEMLTTVLNYVPQLVIGGIVFAVGILLSKVVRQALTSTLEAFQVDHLARRYGFAGHVSKDGAASNTISRALGGLAAAIVIVFFAIAAIGIWDIPGITEPVSGMLQTMLDYIPNILGAALILAVAVFIGRFVSNLAQETLPALGVDDSLRAIGNLDGESSPNFQASKIIGTIAFIGIILMGLTAAMNALNIPQLSDIFGTLLNLGGRIVLGAVIIGAGVFISNVVARILAQSTGELAANVIRYVLMLLITFMGLREMNIGGDIVNTAFSYGLGAAAVAAGIGGAIAFGMGGREWAAKKLNKWWPTTTTRKK